MFQDPPRGAGGSVWGEECLASLQTETQTQISHPELWDLHDMSIF